MSSEVRQDIEAKLRHRFANSRAALAAGLAEVRDACELAGYADGIRAEVGDALPIEAAVLIWAVNRSVIWECFDQALSHRS